MKLAICNEAYRDWPLERVCADVAACGYEGIELALSTLVSDPGGMGNDEARELGRMAREAGLEMVGLHWLLAAPPGLGLISSDPDTRSRTRGHLEELARICGAMGGKVLVLGSPQQRRRPPGEDDDLCFGWAVETCRAVAETCAGYGVTLAVEPLSPAVTDFLTTAREASRLIEAVDHPACRLHLDVYAMSSEAGSVADIIRAHGRHLVHVHVNDAAGGPPGSGETEFEPIIAALREVGYEGWLSVEVFEDSPDGPAIARASLRALRELCG